MLRTMDLDLLKHSDTLVVQHFEGNHVCVMTCDDLARLTKTLRHWCECMLCTCGLPGIDERVATFLSLTAANDLLDVLGILALEHVLGAKHATISTAA